MSQDDNENKKGFIGENFDIGDLPILDPSKFHLLNLKDVFGKQIKENIDTFEGIFRPLYKSGFLLYHREICSAMAPIVDVLDHTTGVRKKMLMFGSNNYLGFANDETIKKKVIKTIEEYGIGMAGPMILNGSGTIQKQLEKKLAEFKGKEDAIVLPSGYQANLAWVNSLITDNAILLYDEASHASLIDAIRLGKKRAFRFLAQDMASLEEQLTKYRSEDPKRDIFVCMQGVYSMSGEVADLRPAADLCVKYNAFLVVDDAHGTGVLGRGHGTAEHYGVSSKVFLTMGTFSKSFAVTGGFLAGDKKTINFIRFFARPYFFTAAITPMVASAVLAGIEEIEAHPERVQQVLDNAEYLRTQLDKAHIKYIRTESAVVPVFPPANSVFRKIALELHKEGLFINPIEPPAVTLGTERFRMSVMATHSKADIEKAVAILKKVFEQ
ncbi:MAG: pyridoxal phosphate-dependent aminotransferase family protein [Bacteriovorax sp.]|nr:pyridoxal phosphate-dependent aminotransferase family protein [Bacteriovorax sp.]